MLICPNCGAIAGIIDLDHLTGGHNSGVHGHIPHEPGHEHHGEMGWGGWVMLGLAVAGLVASLFAAGSAPQFHHHCSRCGHNW